MEFVGIKELSQKTSRYIGSPDWVVVTKNGKPVKLMIDIDEEDLEDIILAKHFKLDELAEQAKQDHRAGKTVSMRNYLKKRG